MRNDWDLLLMRCLMCLLSYPYSVLCTPNASSCIDDTVPRGYEALLEMSSRSRRHGGQPHTAKLQLPISETSATVEKIALGARGSQLQLFDSILHLQIHDSLSKCASIKNSPKKMEPLQVRLRQATRTVNGLVLSQGRFDMFFSD